MIYSTKHLNKDEYVQIAGKYYTTRKEWFDMPENQRHLELCILLANRRKQLMFTGQSAAAARGIARTDPFEMRAHCISTTRMSEDIIRWHYGERDRASTIESGILAASPIRTVCDLAKFDSPESLLVSINHCLFNDLFSREQLLEEIENKRGMNGRRILGKLLRFSTKQCESALETIAWISIYQAGFVVPQQQLIIRKEKDFIARVDMFWELRDRKVILELDGKIKYKENSKYDGNSKFKKDDVLYDEKIREDRLRELGYEVIRATWAEVRSGVFVKKLCAKKIPLRRNFTGTFPTR